MFIIPSNHYPRTDHLLILTYIHNMAALLWASKQLGKVCFIITSIRFELLLDIILTLEHGDQLRLLCWSPARSEFLSYLRKHHFDFGEKRLFLVAMHLAEKHGNGNAKRLRQLVGCMQN